MWKRSEVERLTGLTRHMIQDLCNQNTAGDGLAFWVPAVSKPGYSRFDEGDLLVFFLVKQLSCAGFALSEVAGAAGDMLEDGMAFEEHMHAKADTLRGDREALEAKIRTADLLEASASYAPEQRIYAIMDMVIARDIDWAIKNDVLAAQVDSALVRNVREVCARAREDVFQAMGWAVNGPHVKMEEARSEKAPTWEVDRFNDSLADLMDRDVAATDDEAVRFIWETAASAWRKWGVRGMQPARRRDEELAVSLIVRAASMFLSKREHGVPVELVCGRGTFGYLGQASEACVERLEHQFQSQMQ